MSNVLHIGVVSKGGSFWGRNATGYTAHILLNAILGRPVYCDIRSHRISSGIWESVIMQNSGKSWKIKLRKNQKFHNGQKVVIEDVEFAFSHLLSCPYSTPDQQLVSDIQETRVLDASTLKIILNCPDTTWINSVASCMFSPIPRAEQDLSGSFLNSPSRSCGSHFAWKSYPIGAGPYKIVDGDQKDVWLERFDACQIPGIFSKDSPKLIRLSICREKTFNEFDIFFNASGSKKVFSQGFELVSINLTECIMGLYFNFDLPVVREDCFRKAVFLALDREKLPFEDASNQKTHIMIPQQFQNGKHQFQEPRHDLDEASSLFEKVLDKYRVQRFVVYSPEKTPPAWKRIVVNQLSQAGLPVEIQSKPKEGKNKESDGTPFLFTGYIPSGPQVLSIFKSFREGSGWVSQLNARDMIYNRLLDKIVCAGKETKKKLVQKLQERFLEKNYAIPLFETQLSFLIDPKKIKTVHPEKQDLSPRIDLIRLVE